MTNNKYLKALRHVAICIAVIGVMFIANSTSAQKSNTSGGQLAAQTLLAPPLNYCESDFTGDQMTDIVFFNPSLSNWSIDDGHGGHTSVTFASLGDQPVAADYDGDHVADITVVRTKSGLFTWKTIQSSDGVSVDVNWGVKGDVPVKGDYDGDGKTDPAVWRSTDASWYILASSSESVIAIQFGLSSDLAVPGDYDGDGSTDIAIFRQSENAFYFISSYDSRIRTQRWDPIFADANEVFVPADYDGDGTTDFASFNSQFGLWTILESSNGHYRVEAFDVEPVVCLPWETCRVGDYAMPADYDNDGKVDAATWNRRGAVIMAHTSSGDTMKFITETSAETIPVTAFFMTN